MYVHGGSINTATVDNGVVRVTDRQSVAMGIWFNGHYLTDKCLLARFNCGPFVGLQVGTGSGNSNVINSMALGVSIAAPSTDGNSQDSTWILNFGYGVTTRKALAASYVDGQPLPSGSNQPVLVSRTGYGPVLMFSYQLGTPKQPGQAK